jgi:flavin-dependent dehydrogenase
MEPTMSENAMPVNDGASQAWDVAVIGAGPAGSVAAALLARAGARTLLINREAFPRDKVCGGCLAPEGTAALGATFGPDILRGGLLLDRLVIAAGGRRIDLPVGPFTSISRRDLDLALVRAALREGASLCIARATVIGRGVLALRDASHARTLRAGLVIAADGLSGSSLSGDPRFGWIDDPGSPLGLGTVVPTDLLPVHRATITMLCGDPGYVGLAPLADGTASVAAAISPGALRHGAGLAVADIARQCGHDPTPFARLRFRGTRPLTRRRAAVEADGVLVLGDAAGYVEPFTGEGMTWAVLGAREAAPVALGILQGRVRPGEWTDRLGRLLALRRLRCRLLTTALRHAPRLDAAMSLAHCLPAVASGLARRLTRPPRPAAELAP